MGQQAWCLQLVNSVKQGMARLKEIKRHTQLQCMIPDWILEKLKTMLILGDVKRIIYFGASLVAQWLRICLPMQGTRVRALVWEDPTCCGATRPVSHNY